MSEDIKTRIKRAQALAKELKYADDAGFNVEDFIPNKDKSLYNQALQVRDLYEEGLAEQKMRNTGLSVPDSKAPARVREQFLYDIAKENYPELEFDLELRKNLKMLNEQGELKDVYGYYEPSTRKIKVRDTGDILKDASTIFHEAPHQYDDVIRNFDGTPDINKKALIEAIQKNEIDLKSGKKVKPIRPEQAFEILHKGHFDEIPKLRPGGTLKGALMAMIKSGKSKAILPLATGGAGLAVSGLAEAFDAEELGRDSDSPSSDVKVTRNSPDPQLSRASEKETRMLEQFGTGEEVTMPEENPARKRMEQNMRAADNIKLKALQRMLGK